MNVNNQVIIDGTKKPLTRVDIEQRIQQGGGSNKLDLSGANLSGADLHQTHLAYADLRDANLNGAHLSETDLSGASLIGIRISTESKEELLQAIGVQWNT